MTRGRSVKSIGGGRRLEPYECIQRSIRLKNLLKSIKQRRATIIPKRVRSGVKDGKGLTHIKIKRKKKAKKTYKETLSVCRNHAQTETVLQGSTYQDMLAKLHNDSGSIYTP